MVGALDQHVAFVSHFSLFHIFSPLQSGGELHKFGFAFSKHVNVLCISEVGDGSSSNEYGGVELMQGFSLVFSRKMLNRRRQVFPSRY